jgi:ribonucleoside-diphosphate reductase beta chain
MGNSNKLNKHRCPRYHARNLSPFIELQDVQELANFFGRRVSAYQVGISGQAVFDEAF